VKRKRDPLEPLSSGRAKVPFAWVLDEIASLDPTTRPMFGCTAVYARGKIVFILRQKGGQPDDGVWLATTREHHDALRRELPSMRSIQVFGDGETGWQILPEEMDGFEEEVLRACALVRGDDPRIGKVPKPRRARKAARPVKVADAKRVKPAKKAKKGAVKRAPKKRARSL
jgi:hypothetical protein